MSNIEQLLDMAAAIARNALEDHIAGMSKLHAELKEAKSRADTLTNAARSLCTHPSRHEVTWTEDGAYPNEPRSRHDCNICKAENV